MANTPENRITSEMVAVVDVSNTILDVVTRREMRALKLRHRAVFIAVIDDQDRLLLHRRSPHKDVWPNWCDIAVGGVVTVGEDFATAAHREVSEELGIVDSDLKEIDGGVVQTFDDDTVSLVGRCYVLHHSGPFHFHDGEVVEAWWSTRQEFELARQHEKFLPDSVALLLPLLTAWK